MDIQIISGFLGAGKTTFLNRYLPLLGGKICVIENEFGSISLDGSLIEGGAGIREVTAGCICCSLSNDFQQVLKELKTTADPDRILVEPTGIGRLSDILKACGKLNEAYLSEFPVSKCITIVDVTDYEENMSCFGEFYTDQIRHADLLFLSHTENRTPAEIDAICADLGKQNPAAMICKSDFRELEDDMLRDLVNAAPARSAFFAVGEDHHLEDGHHHTHDHDHHHAEEVFSAETLRKIRLTSLSPSAFAEKLLSGTAGRILRGKGYIRTSQGTLIYLDVTPSGSSFRNADPKKAGDKADFSIVIGCGLSEEELHKIG